MSEVRYTVKACRCSIRVFSNGWHVSGPDGKDLAWSPHFSEAFKRAERLAHTDRLRDRKHEELFETLWRRPETYMPVYVGTLWEAVQTVSGETVVSADDLLGDLPPRYAPGGFIPPVHVKRSEREGVQ